MTEEIPQWAIERADDLSARNAGYYPHRHAFARYIAEHEQPPVDPLLLEARKIVIAANTYRTNRQTKAIEDGLAGNRQVEAVLAGIKRGLELAKEQDQ